MIPAYAVIIRGPLGSGKTTISTRLANILGATHIPIDRIIDRPDIEEWDDVRGCYSERCFLRANEVAAEEAKSTLAEGKPVIVDGNFYWPSQVEDLPRRLVFRTYVFTLKVPLAMCIERDRLRDDTHGEEATRDVFALSTSFSTGIEVDGTGSVEETVNAILGYLPTTSESTSHPAS